MTCHFRHVNELSDLSRRRRVLLWLAVLSGLLLAMLDQTIVGTALPQIVYDLGGELWYVWAITAYLVPATVLLPVFAGLSDRYGRQRILLSGIGLFVLGSALCAIAQSMGSGRSASPSSKRRPRRDRATRHQPRAPEPAIPAI
jgi:MFS family permease